MRSELNVTCLHSMSDTLISEIVVTTSQNIQLSIQIYHKANYI
jgi:hypothetical protein